jgi:hypothetical protein
MAAAPMVRHCERWRRGQWQRGLWLQRGRWLQRGQPRGRLQRHVRAGHGDVAIAVHLRDGRLSRRHRLHHAAWMDVRRVFKLPSFLLAFGGRGGRGWVQNRPRALPSLLLSSSLLQLIRRAVIAKADAAAFGAAAADGCCCWCHCCCAEAATAA